MDSASTDDGPLLPGHLQDRLADLDSRRFELFVAAIYGETGWDTEVTGEGPDGGVDVYLEQPGRRRLIDAKCHSDSPGSPAIKKLFATAHLENATEIAIVSPQRYSNSARKTARGLQNKSDLTIDLVTHMDLYWLVEENGLWDIVHEYTNDINEPEVQSALSW